MERWYRMIDRDYLLKAEILLTDLIMEAQREAHDDSKLIDLLGKTIDQLSRVRSLCWVREGEDE